MDLDDRIHDFRNCNLRGAIFAGSSILAKFNGADLEGADFSSCNVKTCDFSGAKLAGATFCGAAINSAVFDGADLSGANFRGATAYGHIFADGELP
ncbi:pentapeptide repeat-containing protein [Mesorhizobium amorphae]